MSALIRVPVGEHDVPCVDVNGEPRIVLKHAINGLGLDYSTQYAKLKGKSWATVGLCPMVAEDGRTRDMVVVTVRTFLMLLATVDEHRVAPAVKPKLITYQAEVADAIEAYWTRGAAVNPRAAGFVIPQTMGDALRLAADEHDRANAAEKRVAELEPKAAAADALMETEGAVSMGAVANAFQLGRQELFDMLREEKILQKDRRPYQEYAAWFRVTIRHYDDSNGVPRPYVNARMYPAGALRLHALLTKRGRELRKPVFDNQLSLLNGGAA